MTFVVAKCTQCGANIEVNEEKEAGICQYCGSAFVTKKAINNYNIQLDSLDAKYKKLFEAGAAYLQLKDYDSAAEIYKTMVKEYPGKCEGYANLIISISKDFTDNSYATYHNYKDIILDLKDKMQQFVDTSNDKFAYVMSKTDYYLEKTKILIELENAKNRFTDTDKKYLQQKANDALGILTIYFPFLSIFVITIGAFIFSDIKNLESLFLWLLIALNFILLKVGFIYLKAYKGYKRQLNAFEGERIKNDELIKQIETDLEMFENNNNKEIESAIEKSVLKQ